MRLLHTLQPLILGIYLCSVCSKMYPSLPPQTSPTMRTCPPPHSLSQDHSTQYWSAENQHWRTHTMSFAKQIKRFIGAQWNGSTIGTMYCLYQGPEMTFPIKLEYDTMVSSPSGGKWSKDLGHFKNCISNDINDCLFLAPPKEKKANLYEELDHIKTQPPTEIAF